MVRDARDVCGSLVRRAGREEQRGDEPQRGWRTLGARTDITRVFTPSLFSKVRQTSGKGRDRGNRNLLYSA
jgi:hypothetical protein